jgi:tetratricopeptide (TPR) repeat protein
MLSKTTIRFFSVFFTIIFLASTAVAQDADLIALRDDMARRYFEPETHMRLAKYIHDKGNRLVAFFILESARRSRFKENEFNQAFVRYFKEDPFNNSSEAEAKLLNELSQKPESVDLLTKLADIYVSREEYGNAKLYFEKVMSLQPANETAISALSEVYARSGDKEKSKKLIDDFAMKYPESFIGYEQKIYEANQKNNSAVAKELLTTAMGKFASDSKIFMMYGGMMQKENNLFEAEKYYVKGASYEKNNANIPAYVGKFYHRILKNPEKALDYYLRAYFIDPHAYDGEYAESRVRSLAWGVAENEVERKIKNNTTLELLAKNQNPVIAGMALTKIGEAWDKKYINVLMDLMGHDDPNNRAEAMELLKNNTGKEFDEQLKILLKDSDLRKRGLAAYIAVHHWKKESHELMQKWLNEDAQLIRFDAISALIIDGGVEGKKIVKSHRTKETNPWLKKLINEELK